MAATKTRFWTKVDRTSDDNACWNWTASRQRLGYGTVYIFGKVLLAHRVSYEWSVDQELPSNVFLDHICHNPPCVNPAHLRPVTNKQNCENRRGARIGSRSGIQGVTLNLSGRWQARVCHKGVEYHLGMFDTAEQAGEAARVKRLELTHNDMDRIA